MAERPKHVDGIKRKLVQQRKEWGYPLNLKPIVVTKDTSVFEHSFPGTYKYYVKHTGSLIAESDIDHEGGWHDVTWTIDYDKDKPLFYIKLSSERDTNPLIELGFQSRGVPSKFSPDYTTFPCITGKYTFLGELFEFEDIRRPLLEGVPAIGVTTGEEVQTTWREENEKIIITTVSNNGITEELTLPKFFDFSWMHRLADSTAQAKDISLPYMQWPHILGATFSSPSPKEK